MPPEEESKEAMLGKRRTQDNIHSEPSQIVTDVKAIQQRTKSNGAMLGIPKVKQPLRSSSNKSFASIVDKQLDSNSDIPPSEMRFKKHSAITADSG